MHRQESTPAPPTVRFSKTESRPCLTSPWIPRTPSVPFTRQCQSSERWPPPPPRPRWDGRVRGTHRAAALPGGGDLWSEKRHRVRPFDLRHPGQAGRGVPTAVGPVRHRPLRAAVQAGHLQRAQRPTRLLHLDRGPRPVPGRHGDQRRCDRRRGLVQRQRHPELLAFGANLASPRSAGPTGGRSPRPRPSGGCTSGAVSTSPPPATAGPAAATSPTAGWTARSGPYSQQQWYTRDSSVGGWANAVWNMVFSGVQGAPAQSLPNPPSPALRHHTGVPREKPFLYLNGSEYRVFLPERRTDARGTTWGSGTPRGTSLPLTQFYVAHPPRHRRHPERRAHPGPPSAADPGDLPPRPADPGRPRGRRWSSDSVTPP